MDKFDKELLSAVEVRRDEDLYLVGPFWLVADSLKKLNQGSFSLIAKKFLVDYDGQYQMKVPKSQFTHKGIWEAEYKSQYGHSFDYYPRGRVSFDNTTKQACINIPKGLDEKIILPTIANAYDVDLDFAVIKYTDPTSGNHYTFQLT